MRAAVWRTEGAGSTAASSGDTTTAPTAATAATLAWQGLWLAALGAPWVLLFHRLCSFWEVNPQYAYAWAVPFLGAILAVLRWPAQPVRQQPAARTIRGGPLAFMMLGAALVLLFPLRLLQEAAPDWSVANWSLALAVALTTFAYLGRSGGFRWASWFLFPLLFLFTAVPWPQRFDLWLTQSLMRGVAAATVEILGWFNLPAVRQGNIICLPTGAVGIDEACSGIRSLQAMLMASLFLGELWRLTISRRLALVIAGLLLALVGNVIRTTLLSTVASRAGMDAIHAWHDPAGFSILCFGLVGTWLLGSRWRRDLTSPATPGVGWTAAAPVFPPLPVLPAVLPVGLILFLLGTEATVHLWYGRHESNVPPPHLAVAWPTSEGTFRPVTIPDTTRRLLLYSDGDAATWRDPGTGGREWSLYHFRWAPGRTSTQSARLHRPETCLEASGATLLRDFGRQEITVPGGGSLVFQGYQFHTERALLYVLFALHEQQPAADRELAAAMRQDWSGWSRVQRALAGQRNLGQESLELVMSSSGPEEDPMAVMRDRVRQLIRLSSSSTPARP